MPIYEFVCHKCGHHFEKLCRQGEEKASCPACQGKETSRLFSAFAVKAQNNGSSVPTSSGGGCAGCFGGNCPGCH